MPRVFNQKIKILYLMRVFLERTDEEHPMSVKDLIIYLNSLGISAERKTIYDDIETLRNFGMDILNRREKPAGFYLASREFELPELKLLVDAVQSSRFITSGKSRQLIGKLESLASVYEARACIIILMRSTGHLPITGRYLFSTVNGQWRKNCGLRRTVIGIVSVRGDLSGRMRIIIL